jgi:hypothetical protein
MFANLVSLAPQALFTCGYPRGLGAPPRRQAFSFELARQGPRRVPAPAAGPGETTT